LVEYLYWSSAAAPPGTMAEALGHFTGLPGQRERLSDAEPPSIPSATPVRWGARDRFPPPAPGGRAAARIPAAICCAIRNAGHSPNWEAPAAVNRLLVPFLAHGADA